MIAGLGHDVVNVAQFAEQMREGNGWRALFSVRELRQCSLRAEAKHDDEALHIAARWSGKEAVIKAWCEALEIGDAAYPYTLDNTPWSCIEILDDAHGCPRVQLAQKVQDKLCASLSLKLAEPSNTTELAEPSNTTELAKLAEPTNIPNTSENICNAIRWHISLTHDGSVQNNTAVASAVAMLEIL
ncbi:4'-phosphopantetheinyl transferase superfamily protein [Bifidobacteriaceae bacterium NR002]|nr:4'-phosphopantetheinyl transferase superfamily protein [Bifidobacteriaceae bacterium NR002]MDZ7549989.1 4'-phosphopantetheinyl transferase superfamily protein [Bifidobacteriaceae bacterium NR047]